MLDPCFWCQRKKCHEHHGLEIAAYRTRLHFAAVRALKGKLRLQGIRGVIERSEPVKVVKVVETQDPVYAAIIDLLCLKPADMGIEEHRIKAHLLEFSKTMSWVEAWEKANREAAKDATRTHPIYPRFTRQESRNIRTYKPKNGSM